MDIAVIDIARAVVVLRRYLILAAAGLCAVACGSSGSTAAPPLASPGAASATAVATESPPPGDIPDTTVYVAYRPASGQYEVKVPEGWARTVSPARVSFTDKLNSITIQTVRAAAPATVASARTAEVPRIQGLVHAFTLDGVGTVSRAAGQVVVTLAGPAGADNVDPWRTVTDSFRWRP
jgi:hypothetical protein